MQFSTEIKAGSISDKSPISWNDLINLQFWQFLNQDPFLPKPLSMLRQTRATFVSMTGIEKPVKVRIRSEMFKNKFKPKSFNLMPINC